MPICTKPEDLQVNSTTIKDGLLVSLAMPVNVIGKPIRNVGPVRLDIDVLEELLLHEIAVGTGMIAGQADVFIKVKAGGTGKIQLPVPVQPYQLPIQGHRGASGGKSKHGIRLLLQQLP